MEFNFLFIRSKYNLFVMKYSGHAISASPLYSTWFDRPVLLSISISLKQDVSVKHSRAPAGVIQDHRVKDTGR